MNTTQHNHNDHISTHGQHRAVRFFCAAPKAKAVALVGDFNHWHPFPMTPSVDGWWQAQVELTHGHHQYRFLVDGEPMLDPHATGIVRDENNERASLVAVS
jgi:1,4-alpha-glucan branching enzyme